MANASSVDTICAPAKDAALNAARGSELHAAFARIGTLLRIARRSRALLGSAGGAAGRGSSVAGLGSGARSPDATQSHRQRLGIGRIAQRLGSCNQLLAEQREQILVKRL